MHFAPVPAGSAEIAVLFFELGVLLVVMALLARLATRLGFSPVPLYLLGGLFIGAIGIVPMSYETEAFIQAGAEIGVILLLFMIGLEYSGEELTSSLRTGWVSGVADLVLNFTPGLVLGLILGWGWVTALLLGGITYISSSGVIAKLLNDLNWLGNRETPAVLTVLVLEDLAMAVFLPLMVVLLVGTGVVSGVISLTVALVTVAVVLIVAVRYGGIMSRYLGGGTDEIQLLTVFGIILLVAGIAQQLQVSAAVGAFLVGIALSGPIGEKAHELLGPMRDLFAAIFFLFFGLQTDAASLPAAIPLALTLGLVTALTKVATGWFAARRRGVGALGRWRAGAMLIPRGEFSIVIAGLGASAGLTSDLLPLSAAYVLIMAVVGSILVRAVEPLYKGRQARRRAAVAGSVESLSP
jgi:CPA2 family monovalent cation:H+ antiporter-2